MTVKEIVKQYLTEHGYDGLSGDLCACSIEKEEDFMDCFSDYPTDCTPGYKAPCTCGGKGCEYHIVEEKSE
jgi:hypothetical protein|tara:strand:+ start:7693 stop:7905 length:213 start_codon:yes stop_codon:yes gene_type:complete